MCLFVCTGDILFGQVDLGVILAEKDEDLQVKWESNVDGLQDVGGTLEHDMGEEYTPMQKQTNKKNSCVIEWVFFIRKQSQSTR